MSFRELTAEEQLDICGCCGFAKASALHQMSQGCAEAAQKAVEAVARIPFVAVCACGGSLKNATHGECRCDGVSNGVPSAYIRYGTETIDSEIQWVETPSAGPWYVGVGPEIDDGGYVVPKELVGPLLPDEK